MVFLGDIADCDPDSKSGRDFLQASWNLLTYMKSAGIQHMLELGSKIMKYLLYPILISILLSFSSSFTL